MLTKSHRSDGPSLLRPAIGAGSHDLLPESGGWGSALPVFWWTNGASLCDLADVVMIAR